MEVAEKTLEEQIIYYTQKANEYKNASGKIRDYVEASNKVNDLKEEIKARDGRKAFAEKQEQMRKEAEQAEAERLKNPPPPQVEGKLITICRNKSAFFLAVMDEKHEIPFGYRVRTNVNGQVNDQFFKYDDRTPVESFQIAAKAFFMIT